MVVREGTEKLQLEYNYHNFSYKSTYCVFYMLHIDISLTFTCQSAD
jgi:hypothetical protein